MVILEVISPTKIQFLLFALVSHILLKKLKRMEKWQKDMEEELNMINKNNR